ncbi:MAG: DUF2911 domain-containing protein [Chitinophagaceae bacterium]|nr:DUF2911 domain-containing protein [Chitinophagaceae bacterium]
MKKIQLLVATVCCIWISASAQNRFPAIDKSPMDMIYFPINYPVLKIQNKATDPLIMRVCYSRPQKNGRTVFGELVEFGKVWRLGANEATEIELFRDVKIGTNKLKKGRYTVYAIPTVDKWTIIFNKETDIWGAFQYDAKKDVLRVDIKPEKSTENIEAFSMAFEKLGTGCQLVIGWDDVVAKLPFSW